jgi:hypothetical protein
MALVSPKASDLFGEVKPKKAAELMDSYMGELNKALSNPSSVPGQAPAAPVDSQIEALMANKSLSPDAIGSLNAALASQRTATADIIKDITLTTPLSTSFAAFDLEAPAKMLTPRPTPLRNKIARKKGVGTSHRIKRITGYTGTGTGGQGQIWPGINEGSYNQFGQINYERGAKISYTADDKIFPYFSYSLSDSVSFDANFSGLGYQDLRQLSSTSTLYATMLMEERMLLMSRGTTGNGFSGALTAPTFSTAHPSAGTNQSALTATTYYVNVTADAGVSSAGFGESVVGSEATVAVSAGQVLTVTISTPVAGALGYNIYVGTTSGAETYQGTLRGTGTVTIGGTGTSTSATQFVYSTTSASITRAASDTSAYSTGYDGILATLLNTSNGASINAINSTFSTSNPGVEFQNVFANLYNNTKADPDEILLNGFDRKQLSDAIKNGSTANYRLNLAQADTGDYVGGAVIGGLHNETTGKLVDLTVHPWLPQGVSPVLSYTLPIPDTEVSDVWAVYNVQDYMGIQWPVTQFAYEFSTYFRGTFVSYAPSFNGIVTGIQTA